MNDEPLKTCPECGGELRRIITGGTGIIFKGNGFYVTDKNSASGKASGVSSASGGNKASDRSSASDSKPGEGAPAAPAKTETPGSGASNKDTISKTAS